MVEYVSVTAVGLVIFRTLFHSYLPDIPLALPPALSKDEAMFMLVQSVILVRVRLSNQFH